MARLKSLIGLLIVVAGVYVAWQIFPPYYNNFQFQDTIESEARLNSYNTKSEQEIKELIMKKARELEIPLASDQLTVRRSGNEVSISAEYSVHVDLPVYPLDLKFAPSSKNKKI